MVLNYSDSTPKLWSEKRARRRKKTLFAVRSSERGVFSKPRVAHIPRDGAGDLRAVRNTTELRGSVSENAR